MQLIPEYEVQLNYRKYDLSRDVPRHDHTSAVLPKFRLSAADGVLPVQLGPRTPPGELAKTVPGFAMFVVDADEVSMDRSLEFHTFVEVPDMFATPPAVDSDGTLSFVLNPAFTGASSLAWVP